MDLAKKEQATVVEILQILVGLQLTILIMMYFLDKGIVHLVNKMPENSEKCPSDVSFCQIFTLI